MSNLTIDEIGYWWKGTMVNNVSMIRSESSGILRYYEARMNGSILEVCIRDFNVWMPLEKDEMMSKVDRIKENGKWLT